MTIVRKQVSTLTIGKLQKQSTSLDQRWFRLTVLTVVNRKIYKTFTNVIYETFFHLRKVIYSHLQEKTHLQVIYGKVIYGNAFTAIYSFGTHLQVIYGKFVYRKSFTAIYSF